MMAVCSLGDGPIKEIASGWPSGVDVTVLEMSSNHPIPKINGAYLWLKDQKISARWLLRVDDDSVTDVKALLERQETRFGNAAVHLMSTPDAVPQTDLLTGQIMEYLTSKGMAVASCENEYEASLTSEKALAQIFSSEQSLQFFRDIAKNHSGPGDKCLAFAAGIAGVPKAAAIGMDFQFHHDDMSIAAGRNAHIHYVNWNDVGFRDMLWALEYGDRLPIDTNSLHSLIGRTLDFGRCVGWKLNNMLLNADGTIVSHHTNESYWSVEGDTIWIKDLNGRPTTVLTTILIGEDKRWLIGFHTR
jgi:hypothetical protein